MKKLRLSVATFMGAISGMLDGLQFDADETVERSTIVDDLQELHTLAMEIQENTDKISKFTEEQIEEMAHEYVTRTTMYGDRNAEIGSGGRSYYETELRCFIAGFNSLQKQKQ